MKKILILQPHLDQSRAIAKFLKLYSNEFIITGGFENDDQCPSSMPFFDSLKKLSINSNLNFDAYDIILPTGAKSTYSLLKTKNTIQIGNISFHQENLRVFDKLSMLDIVKELQIPIPNTYLDIQSIQEFPVFYKQRIETGGGIRGIIKSSKELEKLSGEKSIFFQEYIASPETYGVGFLARDGNLITYFIQKELYSLPKAGGSGVILTKYEDKKLVYYTEKILKNLKYNGWGLIEFKYCPKRNDFVFMEVNAKFWASIEFALLNNPIFFKELFDIYYNPLDIDCIVFLDRLAHYGIKQYFKLLLSHNSCYKLNFWDSLIVLFASTLPAGLKKS